MGDSEPGNELPGYSQMFLRDKGFVVYSAPGNELPSYSQLSPRTNNPFLIPNPCRSHTARGRLQQMNCFRQADSLVVVHVRGKISVILPGETTKALELVTF